MFQPFRSVKGKKSKRWAVLIWAPTFLFLVATLVGCDLKEIFRPQGGPPKALDPKSGTAEPAGSIMTANEKFKFHRWIVSEMQEQIFARANSAETDINGWANVLSQRGSIEGVYHGLVLSSEYGAMEKGRPTAKAVRFFAQEMAALDHPNSNDAVDEVRVSREKYAKENMNTPLFTLKKILGEKILNETNSRKNDRVGLAAWYSSFAARWTKTGVSFGLPQRDKSDEAFHFKWANDNNLGMIQWELLNRVHRVMNAYGDITPAPTPSASPAPTPAGK